MCTVDSNGIPTSTCTALTAPGSFSSGTMTFTAPANTTLDANTTYTVSITGEFGRIVGATRSNGEDAGKSAGWSIADVMDAVGSSNNWIQDALGRSVRIRINGFAVNSDGDYTPPSAAPTSNTVLVNIAGTRV